MAQLECDKAEAHTRLEELEQQRNKLDTMLADVRLKVQEENETVSVFIYLPLQLRRLPPYFVLD